MKPTSLNLKSETASVVLAFGAHPDDIEFGCGGVIANEVVRGDRAHFVVCSRGEAASHGTPEERVAEAEKAARLLGATVEFVEMGGDAHFEYRLEHVLRLAAIIRRFKPRIILAPTTVESQHPDHPVVGRVVRDAARLARYGGVAELQPESAHAVEQLLYYAVAPEGEPAGVLPLFFDISDSVALTRWRASMEAHATQLRTRNYVELQLTRARLNGLRAGVGHAIALFSADPLVFTSTAQLGQAARRF